MKKRWLIEFNGLHMEVSDLIFVETTHKDGLHIAQSQVEGERDDRRYYISCNGMSTGWITQRELIVHARSYALDVVSFIEFAPGNEEMYYATCNRYLARLDIIGKSNQNSAYINEEEILPVIMVSKEKIVFDNRRLLNYDVIGRFHMSTWLRDVRTFVEAAKRALYLAENIEECYDTMKWALQKLERQAEAFN